MRIAFLGTGDIALPSLRWLLASEDHEVVGVVTQPDRPVGRKQVLTPSEIKLLALEASIPVAQPERIKKDLDFLREWNPEIIVVMAYGQILPKALLELPPVACINLHASLLPRHRGAAPIQAAIREGDQHSGITIMHIAPGLDTGDIILKHDFALALDETGGSLHDRLADIAPVALEKALKQLADSTASREVQDEAQTTYSPKLTREDGEIDWTKSAEELARQIRAHDPWPGSGTSLPATEGQKPKRLKLFPPVFAVSSEDDKSRAPGEVLGLVDRGDGKVGLGICTGSDTLVIGEVQPNGKKRMPAKDWLLGRPVEVGQCLGSP